MPLAVPTLSIVDNANGTGGVATIAGATALTTNTVYGANWDGGMIGAAFTSLGSRSGNGTVNLAVANGYHWAYVVSTLAGNDGVQSLVQGYRTTSGELPIYEQCLNAVLAKLQALTLTGLEPGNMIAGKFPWRERLLPNKDLAGVTITPPRDSLTPVNSGQNDLAYDCLVTFWNASNQSMQSNFTNHLNWRQTSMDAFQVVSGQAALAGVSAVHNVEVIPGPVFDAGSFVANFDVGQFTLRCLHRRNRGLV